MMDEIEYYQKLSNEELFAELGSIGHNNAIPPPFNILVKRGNGWFEKNKLEIQKIVCTSEKVSKFQEVSKNDAVEIAQILADVYIGFPVTVIAVVICRFGLNKFCENYII